MASKGPKTEKGKIRKIIGNKKDTHSQGRLCPRGTGGLGMYEDEDRLKTPLIREENANGKQYEATLRDTKKILRQHPKNQQKTTYAHFSHICLFVSLYF